MTTNKFLILIAAIVIGVGALLFFIDKKDDVYDTDITDLTGTPAATMSPTPSSSPSASATPKGGKTTKMANGLEIQDIVVGTGAEAKVGNFVTVHYVGMFSDGKVFQSSREMGQSFQFILGAGGVIKGWDQGVPGMKVGGKRKLIIPSALAYGAAGAHGLIPPNADLIFEVELLDTKGN